MLALNAGTVGVDASLAQVVNSNDRKPTPILLFPVATTLRPDVEESLMGSGAGQRRRENRRNVDDPSYRYKRQRNNEAARRSREKRRQQDDVIRHQLEALVVENRELRCQLTLLRRLVDKLAAAGGGGTLASAYLQHNDDEGSGGLLQTARWASTSSLSSVTAVSDQPRADAMDSDELTIDQVTASETGRKNSDKSTTDDCSEFSGRSVQQRQVVSPLNLSQRVYSSSS